MHFVIHVKKTLDIHAPDKPKYVRGNHIPFLNKVPSQKIMTRTGLWNNFAKERTEENRRNYSKHRNCCASILRKSKYFENLNEEKISENKTFWKTIKFILSSICVSRPPAVAQAPSPNLYLTTPAPEFVFIDHGPGFVFSIPRPSICVYRPWLIRIGNNKSQSLYMFLFLFLLFNSFVTVIVDRNETKDNLSKKQINR